MRNSAGAQKDEQAHHSLPTPELELCWGGLMLCPGGHFFGVP
jgi:hypothetical protein